MVSKMSSRRSFKKKFYEDIIPKIYGMGASVVIVGAMFKLLNWPGGSLMLGLGLSTEAVIFLLSAFEPKEKKVDWTKVYPELLENYEGNVAVTSRSLANGPIGEKLEKMFAQAQIDGALIERLGQGMKNLSTSITSMTSMPELAAATQKYAVNVEKASDTLESIHEVQAGIRDAAHRLSGISQDTQGYHEQVQDLMETLNKLNLTYKKELQEADLRSKKTYEVCTHMAESMERMKTAGDETVKFEAELAQLNSKIASLNSIYGNMLTALKN